MESEHPPNPFHHHSTAHRHDYSSLNWTEFFTEQRILEIGESRFNVYLKGNSGPVFFLLHGIVDNLYYIPPSIFTGGGYTGLTWSCFAEELSSKIDCQIVAPDLRGHGNTTTTNDEDLSTERLTKDITEIYTHLYGQSAEKPPMVVVGHSLGGALAVHVINANLLPNVVAMAVIDASRIKYDQLPLQHIAESFLGCNGC